MRGVLTSLRGRAAQASRVNASQQEAEAELSTGGFEVGSRVQARGLAPHGEVGWFVAEVLSHRSKFPPLEVKFVSTLDGKMSSLALPTPRTAFVPVSHVRAA